VSSTDVNSTMLVEADALKWIANLFEESPAAVDAATTREAIPAWDSLGMLTLIAALDEKFDISLTDTESEGLKSVGDILQILRVRGKLA